MNIKWMTYGLRLGVSVLCIGAILLPVQAAVFAPIPSVKPWGPLALSVSAHASQNGASYNSYKHVPVPSPKPLSGSSLNESPLDRSLELEENAYTKLSSFLPSITSIEPSLGKEADGQELNDVALALKNNAPISAQQAKIYKQIFDAQRYGHWNQADEKIINIKDKRLMGHVLYQRYMHSSYISSFDELKTWLASYSDHPNAYSIVKLAESKRNTRKDAINNPGTGTILAQVKAPNIAYSKTYKAKTPRTKNKTKAVRVLSRKIYKLVRQGHSTQALASLDALDPKESILAYMDAAEIDSLKAEIAASFLYNGHITKALELAKKANARSGHYVALAPWITGLALWEQQKFASAAPYFMKVGASPYASGWRSSAGYYWAARSFSRLKKHDKVRDALEGAASHSHTFYGLIATKMLGKPFDFNWENPAFTGKQESLLSNEPSGRRSFLLVAAGQYDRAEEELMRLNYKNAASLRRASLSYAMHVGLPGLALRLGNMVPSKSGDYYDSALYPDVPWEPQNGFNLDPSLLYAVIRQESRFDHEAKSHIGAQGLMQLMPRTARYVAQKNRYGYAVGNLALNDPEINMMLGQDYLTYLLKSQNINGDLISLLAAYNAGPGNLLKWRKRFDSNARAQKSALASDGENTFSDPLLFIETMPIKETRDYVVKVLANYWIYRLRAGEELTSLSHIVEGQSPRYASFMGQESQPFKVANR